MVIGLIKRERERAREETRERERERTSYGRLQVCHHISFIRSLSLFLSLHQHHVDQIGAMAASLLALSLIPDFLLASLYSHHHQQQKQLIINIIY